jgi:ubiquinone/menaquinone biosynthesis C-methylase UbiE
VIYQNPLAYLLALEGTALLHGFAGEYDREFTESRIAEVRRLLDATEVLGNGAELQRVSEVEAYDWWADSYDKPGNQLVDIEQSIVWEILDSLPVGVALDAACGTGRHAEHLSSLGHTIIGVDASPLMLAKAAVKIPGGTFHVNNLENLPFPDHHVDLVVCALALTHVHDLQSVLREFVRVLRPGGHLVISDSRPHFAGIATPVTKNDANGRTGYMPTYNRLASDYLGAALPLGLLVRRCEEPRRPTPIIDPATAAPSGRMPDGVVPNMWELQAWAPEAANAAYRDAPVAVIWHFQLDEGPSWDTSNA